MAKSLWSNYLQVRFPSLPENVGVARVAVASFAAQMDFTLADVDELKVAVSEAVSNAVLHGYPQGPGEVLLELKASGNRLTTTVQDWGVGIADIDQAREPAFSTDPERMGLGFVFMESFSDHLEIRSAPGQGTIVQMTREARSTRSEAG